MYIIIAIISVVVRMFVLPNPFDPLGDVVNITLFNVTLSLTPTILNWIAEPFLHCLAFSVTGIYYSRGSQDAGVGSFLYLLFYVIHTGLLMLMSVAHFAWWVVVPLIVLYLLGHIGVNAIMNSDGGF